MQKTKRNIEIKRLYAEGMLQKEIAAKFGISQNTVSVVVNSEWDEVSNTLKKPSSTKVVKSGAMSDVKLNRTFDLLRKKHPHQEGNKVKTKNGDGKYINATVKQKTEWLFVLSCADGYVRTVSFQELAVDEDLIKGGLR